MNADDPFSTTANLFLSAVEVSNKGIKNGDLCCTPSFVAAERKFIVAYNQDNKICWWAISSFCDRNGVGKKKNVGN